MTIWDMEGWRMWISLWCAAGFIIVGLAVLVLVTDEVVHRMRWRRMRRVLRESRLEWKKR